MWNPTDVPSAKDNLKKAIEIAEKEGDFITKAELEKYLEKLENRNCR
jgi:bacterioferritin (cytochrome b1)